MEDDDIDSLANREFDMNNPTTWNKKGFEDIENTLRKNSISTDGIVCLFTMGQYDFGRDIDHGGVAQNIEKIIVKHCAKTYRHRLLNQDDCQTRKNTCGLYKKRSGKRSFLRH